MSGRPWHDDQTIVLAKRNGPKWPDVKESES